MKKRERMIWEDAACFGAGTPDELAGLSLILFFVGNGSCCPVLAARCPTSLFAPGADLSHVLRLSRDDRRYLDRGLYPARVIRTHVGVGVLVKRLCGVSGMGVYVHIHAPAEAAARIFNNRLLPGSYELSDEVEEAGCELSEDDERLLSLIRPVWTRLMTLTQTFPYAVRGGYVAVDEMAAWIGAAASASGCTLREIYMTDTPTPPAAVPALPDGDIPLSFPTRYERERLFADRNDERMTEETCPGGSVISVVRLFGDDLWEAYLLLCLLLARMYDPKRELTCVLSTDTGRNGGYLDVCLSFSICVVRQDSTEEGACLRPDGLPLLPYPMKAGFDCLTQAMMYNGSTFNCTIGEPDAMPDDPHSAVYPVTCHLAFLHDPKTELEGDVKERIELKYE